MPARISATPCMTARSISPASLGAGTILIEKNAGSQFGAAIRGGDLVCKGNVGSRTGIDMKGGTIIVGGDTGAFTGFMMQRGRMVICGNAGKNLGDSMYDGVIYIAGEPQSLGVDAVWNEITDLDRKWLEQKLRLYGVMPKGGIESFRKIGLSLIHISEPTRLGMI